MTWAQTEETVTTVAAGLLALGIRPEDRVAIASSTRIEWMYADLAIMCAGGGHDQPSTPRPARKDVAFILADSGSRIVFAEDDAQVAKLREQREHLPDVMRVVTFDGTADGEWVHRAWTTCRPWAPGTSSSTRRRSTSRWPPSSPSTWPRSSTPRGPPGSPRAWSSRTGAGPTSAPAPTTLGLLSPDDLQYLWLPLSHSFGKMLAAVQLQIGFPTAVDGRIDKIVENLAVVRPTFMAGPPRIFEKVHAKVVQTVEEEGGLKHRLFRWAFGVGDQAWRARLEGTAPGPLRAAQHALADRLVLAKIRDRLGDGSGSWSPAARPCRRTWRDWFHAAGLPVLEGYALTETSSGACIARLDDLASRRRRAPDGGHRDPGRRGRRDLRPGSRGHAGLPQPARGDGRGARRGRLVRHRRRRRDRRPRAGCGSPTARRT